MKLSQRLYESTKEIWKSYHEHPFVKGIGDGTLDIDKFRFFMIQDYIYLLDYAKVFALGVVKARDEELMRKFASLVNGVLNSEMHVHKTYMERLGITKEEVKNAKPSIVNTSYTKYMLQVGHDMGVLELLVSILSCSWSYKEIGDKLAENPDSLNHEFYGEWVKGYSSESYASDNNEIIELVDKLGENCTEEQFEVLRDIFVNCSRYEYMFWDMSYKKEM